MADLMKCDGCGREMDAGLLDAVLLDPEGNTASGEAYCKACFPRFKRVAEDEWRSAYDYPRRGHIEEQRLKSEEPR